MASVLESKAYIMVRSGYTYRYSILGHHLLNAETLFYKQLLAGSCTEQQHELHHSQQQLLLLHKLGAFHAC